MVTSAKENKKRYKMASGKLSEFDVVNGNWSTYCDRVEMYFLVNKVTEELKVPTIISIIGDTSYELIVNLCSPKKPSELEYAELKKLMQSHLEPKPSVLAERYRFRQYRQREGQTIAEFVSEIKKMARYCDFGANLNENMRDQFVCGLLKEGMRHRLFLEDEKIDFEKAVSLAKAFEGAERNALYTDMSGAGGGAGNGDRAPRDSITRRFSNNRSSLDGVNFMEESMHRLHAGVSCSACGDHRHRWSECRFRDYVCDYCAKRGHLKRVCSGLGRGPMRREKGGEGDYSRTASSGPSGWRSKEPPRQIRGGGGGGGARDWGGARRPQRGALRSVTRAHYVRDDQEHFTERSEEEEVPCDEEPIMQLSLKEYKPVSLILLVEESNVCMEIDTGSALSCISSQLYRDKFHHKPLLPCSLTLSFYDGSKIRPLGYIEVKVKYKNVTKILDLYVIDNGTTSLLGRQWLAELNIEVPKFTLNQMNVDSKDISKQLDEICCRYKELFDGGLGRFRGGRARLHVSADAQPVFCRARPLPYALTARVDAELDAMLAAGVIEPVDCSDWATPLVIVSKADGGIRLCADFKVTLNRVLSVDKYPVPRIEDLLSKLSGSRYFTKLDLSQAYNQVELDETRKFTVINTHRGLFRYNRLVYGLASSPGIFQRIMTNLFRDIPNSVVFLDDILIFSDTLDKHLLVLDKVLSRLQENGLKIKREKCSFLAQRVKYLGYVIEEKGISTDNDKIKPILNMSEPQNVSELRSFLGMVNFYGKFIKNLSSVVAPLNELLKKSSIWSWGKEEKRAFVAVKNELGSTCGLAHYDAALPLVLTCDASGRGLGAVLAQPAASGGVADRPVAYASRALTAAEANYSQIHKEALAIIFAVQKFHHYLFGRHFHLRTDHKPLLSIFNPGAAIPSMTASRLQRWALTLSGYSFSIEYVSTDSNTADALSRMIAAYKEERVENHNDCPEQTYLHFASEALLLDHNVLKKETSRDPILSRVLGYIRDGWPNEVEIREIKPYFNRRSELYIELGCIMWGHRVVVPYSCREKVLNELHDSHMGIIKTKCLARSYVWFPGIDESVDRQCASCEVCAQTAAAPPAHAPRVWHWPDRPWSRLHLDFLGPIAGATYLVVVDACSKWIEIARMSSTSAANVISKLREICSRFGLPKQVVSDNGPPFSSEEFAQFLNKNGIEHCFSAPYHPASNGAAESAVKICKQIIKKAIIEKNDVDTALWRSLLVYRNTEHSTTGESPAQLLQGRALRTRLDCVKPDRAATVRSAQRRQEAAAGGVRRSLPEGEYVWYRTYRPGHKWAKGRILQVLGSTDYQLESYDGTVIHRHVDQIRRRVQSNLNDSPISWYDNPSNGINDHGPVGDAVGAQAGVGVSSAPTTSGSPRGGGGGAAATSTAQGPASLTPTDEQSTRPGQSAPGRRYPLRERRPVVRYGLEID